VTEIRKKESPRGEGECKGGDSGNSPARVSFSFLKEEVEQDRDQRAVLDG